MGWLTDATGAASTLFAAVAAGAAWASVRQGQRLWRAGAEPDLQPQVLLNVQTGTTDMTVVNAGGGLAKGVAFAMLAGGKRVGGIVGDGFMPPGSKIFISTQLPQDENSECLLLYRSVDESSWAVDRVGPRRSLRVGRHGPSTDIETEWVKVHSTSWREAELVGHSITWAEQRYH